MTAAQGTRRLVTIAFRRRIYILLFIYLLTYFLACLLRAISSRWLIEDYVCLYRVIGAYLWLATARVAAGSAKTDEFTVLSLTLVDLETCPLLVCSKRRSVSSTFGDTFGQELGKSRHPERPIAVPGMTPSQQVLDDVIIGRTVSRRRQNDVTVMGEIPSSGEPQLLAAVEVMG